MASCKIAILLDFLEHKHTILRACLECGIFSPFLRFSCEIELIPVKFLCDSCEIPAFQTCPDCMF